MLEVTVVTDLLQWDECTGVISLFVHANVDPECPVACVHNWPTNNINLGWRIQRFNMNCNVYQKERCEIITRAVDNTNLGNAPTRPASMGGLLPCPLLWNSWNMNFPNDVSRGPNISRPTIHLPVLPRCISSILWTVTVLILCRVPYTRSHVSGGMALGSSIRLIIVRTSDQPITKKCCHASNSVSVHISNKCDFCKRRGTTSFFDSP